MFFVERGSQIMALVMAILDNLAAIVAGNVSAAANLVESVMGKAIPLVIGFLASLLGVGGISEKIKEVIEAVRAPVTKAVDWVLKTVVKPVAKMAARAAGWVKGKVKAGAEWLKARGKAAITSFKLKLGREQSHRIQDRSPAQKQADMRQAFTESNRLLRDSTLSIRAIRR